MWWAAVLDLLINGEEPAVSKVKKFSRRKPLGKGLSSYQLFRAALDFFGMFFRTPSKSNIDVRLTAKHDFAAEHVFMKSEHGHRVCCFFARHRITILTTVGVSFPLKNSMDSSLYLLTLHHQSIC